MPRSKALPEQARYLTPPQVAWMLKVHDNKVRSWIRQGLLRAVDVGDRGIPRYRVSSADLDTFLAAKSVAAEK